MRSKLFLLACLTGPAVLGYAAAHGLERKIDEGLHENLAQAYPGTDVSAARTRDACRVPEIRREQPVCTTVDILIAMQWSSLAVTGVTFLMLALISLAGRYAAGNRRLLLRVFRPGLYLTMITACVIALVDGALSVGAVWYGEPLLIGGVHIQLVIALGIGAVVGVYGAIMGARKAMTKTISKVQGKEILETDAPEIWRHVRELSEKLGARPPKNIVVGLDPNFFVTEARVACPGKTLRGRTLYLSLPLSRILTPDELWAVVGHELGHFIGEDTKFSLRFYPIYRGASEALVALLHGSEEGRQRGGLNIAALPAAMLLRHFLESFAEAENGIGRERELAADKVGAQLCGERNYAAALVKIHAFSPIYAGTYDYLNEKVTSGLPDANVAVFFASTAAAKSSKEALVGITEGRMTHPTDSHPPLADRLAALSVTLESVEAAALLTSPNPTAASLVRGHQEIEKRLTDELVVWLVDSGQIQPPKPAT